LVSTQDNKEVRLRPNTSGRSLYRKSNLIIHVLQKKLQYYNQHKSFSRYYSVSGSTQGNKVEHLHPNMSERLQWSFKGVYQQ
jgi:hypothetical protein